MLLTLKKAVEDDDHKKLVRYVRLNVSDNGDEKLPTSYQIVSKITLTDACVMDIVKSGKN